MEKSKGFRIIIVAQFILIIGLLILANYKARREGELMVRNDDLRRELSRCESGVRVD